MERNIETFIGCDAEYADASVVIFGAPFDSTTSYRPGTRFASKTMRSESFGIETYSPYQDKDLEDISVFDGGDLELCFGDVNRALQDITDYTAKVVADHKLPLMIGGEHLVTLGAMRAVAAAYPNLHILHFDAHADLRQDYLGQELSHATVMRRCYELLQGGTLYQFGIRSGERAEFQFAAEHTRMEKFTLHTLEDALKDIEDDPVYLSIDLDVLDPSIFPGTGTPEAGGVSFTDLLNAIRKMEGLHIVGCDVNELSPMYDLSGGSTAVACKLLRELLLVVGK